MTEKTLYRFRFRPLTRDTPIMELETGPFTPLEASSYGQMATAQRTMTTGEAWVCDYSPIVEASAEETPSGRPLLWVAFAITVIALPLRPFPVGSPMKHSDAWNSLVVPAGIVATLTEDGILLRRDSQERVTAWVRKTFTPEEARDAPERSLRVAEEAVELAQACGVDAATVHRLVDYVFSRPAGKPAQEIAGTMVTLYAMAEAIDVNADAAFETELARINQPEVIERCRRRQHEKRAAMKTRACTCGASDGSPHNGLCDLVRDPQGK